MLKLILIGKNNLDNLKSKIGVHSLKNINLVGLISDTHIPEAGHSLWPEVLNAFKEVDIILHAGDMHDLSVLKELEKIAPVLACRGNGDDGSSGRPIMPNHPSVNLNQLIHINTFSIGLTHSFIFDPRLGISVDNQMKEKFGQDVDIVVAGDTHVPVVQSISDSSFIINSGSALLPYNFNPQLGTIGFIEFIGSKDFDMWIEVLHE